MRTVFVIVAVLAVALPSRSAAQADSLNRFRLYNACAQIDLVVADVPEEGDAIGLTRERVQVLAESRLRAARLYDADATPYLYVNVGVLVSDYREQGAYSITLQFNKALYDSASERSGRAVTWQRGRYGMHGGDAGFIMQNLSERLDHFVLEYLRINEDACG